MPLELELREPSHDKLEGDAQYVVELRIADGPEDAGKWRTSIEDQGDGSRVVTRELIRDRRRDLALVPPAVLRSIARRAGCHPRRGALPRRSSRSRPGSSSGSRRARTASRGSPGRQSGGDDPPDHELDQARAEAVA